jgi:sRNA-binding protein
MTTIAAPRRTETENPRAVMGGNRPPLDVEARFAFDEALEATKPGLRERIDQLLAASDRATATDEESAGKCGELVKQIRAAAKAVDDAHTTAKGPYLAAGRAVDAAKNELRGPLDTAKGKVEARQTQFLREQEAIRQAELRRQREEEEARRREEADRLASEQASNAAPVEDAPPPPAPEPERQVIRGDYGATVSGQKIWLSQVEDYEVAFIAVANNSKVREAIDTAIKAMVRGGVHEIPGVRIWSDVKASNR